MDRQALVKLANETRQIVLDGCYTTGTGEQVYLHHRPTGPLSYLIRPCDWPDIIEWASLGCSAMSGYSSLHVTHETTLAAIQRLWHDSSVQYQGETVGIDYRPIIMVLNFASGTHPGGGWLRGSEAQEESLARASDLVCSLERWPQYYQANEGASPYYTDHAIWSPGVTFFRGDRDTVLVPRYNANVLTIPAPKRVDMKMSDESALYKVLQHRIKCMFAQAFQCQQRHLVLGAWGCGVFRNDPKVVAKLFREELEQWKHIFTSVTFAIHDSTERQQVYHAFKEALI